MHKVLIISSFVKYFSQFFLCSSFHGFLFFYFFNIHMHIYCCSFVYLWNTLFKVCAQCVIYRIFYIPDERYVFIVILSLIHFSTFDFFYLVYNTKGFLLPSKWKNFMYHISIFALAFFCLVLDEMHRRLFHVRSQLLLLRWFWKQMCALDWIYEWEFVCVHVSKGAIEEKNIFYMCVCVCVCIVESKHGVCFDQYVNFLYSLNCVPGFHSIPSCCYVFKNKFTYNFWCMLK